VTTSTPKSDERLEPHGAKRQPCVPTSAFDDLPAAPRYVPATPASATNTHPWLNCASLSPARALRKMAAPSASTRTGLLLAWSSHRPNSRSRLRLRSLQRRQLHRLHRLRRLPSDLARAWRRRASPCVAPGERAFRPTTRTRPFFIRDALVLSNFQHPPFASVGDGRADTQRTTHTTGVSGEDSLRGALCSLACGRAGVSNVAPPGPGEASSRLNSRSPAGFCPPNGSAQNGACESTVVPTTAWGPSRRQTSSRGRPPRSALYPPHSRTVPVLRARCRD
jgi:hypothetical protein